MFRYVMGTVQIFPGGKTNTPRMRCTYLLLNLGTLLPVLLFSFHPRIRFYRHWRTYLPALFLSATVFILWDILFTGWAVWGFNPKYVTGLYAFRLPLEEWLFFVCIPYACVFTAY